MNKGLFKKKMRNNYIDVYKNSKAIKNIHTINEIYLVNYRKILISDIKKLLFCQILLEHRVESHKISSQKTISIGQKRQHNISISRKLIIIRI